MSCGQRCGGRRAPRHDEASGETPWRHPATRRSDLTTGDRAACSGPSSTSTITTVLSLVTAASVLVACDRSSTPRAERAGTGDSLAARLDMAAHLDTTEAEFTLYLERDGDLDALPVPRPWLVPPQEAEAEEGAFVSSFHYDTVVTAFSIDDRRVGLHLSSYQIQEEGSARAAAGRDVFLVFDREGRSLRPGGLDLGITKSRGRQMGCFAATFHAFFVGDVDGDGAADLGVRPERVACRPDASRDESDLELPLRPVYERSPLRWYTFTGDGWTYDGAHDGRVPPARRELPLLGLDMTPVDFVRQQQDRSRR